MKNVVLNILYVSAIFHAIHANSQIVVYSAPFDGGSFYSWTSQNIASPWGNQSASYNIWKVNTNESGQPPNTCGTTGAPSTLHMCSNFATGAAYISNYYTNRRISSPNINTSGHANLTLRFNFIGNGCETRDKAYLQYSIDGGTSWISPVVAPTSASPAMAAGGNLNNLKSQVCASGQGRWTNLTWDLPATCENISNLRIAFVWQNNDGAAGCSGSASDPSFAVYNLSITKPDVVPIELLYFKGLQNEYSTQLEWATVSEINNDFFSIEKSYNGYDFEGITSVAGAGNSNEVRRYTYTDFEIPPDIVFYRLKQTDFDGTETYSNIIAFEPEGKPNLSVYPNPTEDVLFVDLSQAIGNDVFVEIFHVSGQLVWYERFVSSYDYESFNIDVSAFPPGVYLVRVVVDNKQFFHKFLKE